MSDDALLTLSRLIDERVAAAATPPTPKRGLIARFFWWLGAPVRAIVSLDRRKIRSLFSIAILSGIIALSVENWTYMWLAYKAVAAGEPMTPWLGFIIERTRYNSALQGWFAVIVGLIVFGADYFRARWGDREFTAGSGEPPAPEPQRRDDRVPPKRGKSEPAPSSIPPDLETPRP